MASEDSRYRDRPRRFICSVSRAIHRRPRSERCAPDCMDRSTDANRSKSRRFAVLSGCSSKNGTTLPSRSSRRFTEKRRRTCRWSSGRRLSITRPHPNSSSRSSSAGLEDAAWVTANSCWTCPAETATPVAHYRDRKAAFTVDEADNPLLNTWPFLLIARTGRIVTAHILTLKTG
jgi:hypothetical protein